MKTGHCTLVTVICVETGVDADDAIMRVLCVVYYNLLYSCSLYYVVRNTSIRYKLQRGNGCGVRAVWWALAADAPGINMVCRKA